MRVNNFPNEFKDLLASRKLSRIDRYQLENTIKPCYVTTHSYWVLVLSLIIKDQAEMFLKKKYNRSIDYRTIVEMATFHDMGESVTGDADHIVKRAGVINGEEEERFIRERFENSKIFGKYLSSILMDNNEDRALEKAIVKCADILEHLIFCYEEQEIFGNKSMYEPIAKGVEIVWEKHRDLYTGSSLVRQITDHCEKVLTSNPLIGEHA